MGLDMFAHVTSAKFDKEVDFDTADIIEEELFYWRKHPDLHGWMERLYRKKGGSADTFNCVPVKLTGEDLDSLQKDLNDLPETSGFFFGQSWRNEEEYQRDCLFILRAKEEIKKGNTVYYTSWW